jgi:hypothetical protein
MNHTDLLRHVLGNVDSWADQLQEAKTDAEGMATVQHVEANMRQTTFFIRKILGTGPPDPDANGS